MSPANTCPAFTPICSGSDGCRSTISRSASSICSSFSPEPTGAPGGEDDLAAVGIDVGGEETDAARIDRFLDDADQLVEARGRRVRRPGDECVQPGEVQERDRHPAVFRPTFGPTQHLAERDGHEPAQVAVDVGEHDRAGPGLGDRAAQGEARAGRRADVRRRERARRSRDR